MTSCRVLCHQRPKLYVLSQYMSTAPSAPDTKCVKPPNPTKISSDMVGPPDPVSNLRKVIFRESANETPLEKQYRELRGEVQDWNQNFWTQHNFRFFQEREDYFKNNLPEGKNNLTADEMSVFYKAFLDKNWKSHISYNIEWYKKNFTLLTMAIKIKFRKLLRLKHTK